MEGLTVQVTKTRDGLRDYVQITSPDQLSINIVLIADEIVLEDHRKPRRKRGVQKKEKARG